MALLGTINNFGGKIPAQQQVIKQFVLAADNNQAYWYYKKLSSGLIVGTWTTSALIPRPANIFAATIN